MFVLYSCTNVGNQNISNQNISNETFNDSALFYYNQFVERFGGMQEEDMDSVIDYYSMSIQQLQDTINANVIMEKDESCYQAEKDLKQEYLINYEDAILISQRYKFYKSVNDSTLKTLR